MEQRLSLVTLGVADIGDAREFYEQLGWRGQEVQETVFFQAGGIGVVLWGRDKLAEDSGVHGGDGDGFGGISLAHNVRSPAEVDAIVAAAGNAGATVTARRGPRSTAAMQAASRIPMGMSGRSRTTPGSLWTMTAPSRSLTSALTTDHT